MIKQFLSNLNILLKSIIMTELLLANLNILLKLDHHNTTIFDKFKYFIKVRLS
jgi:hypothetical protein